MATGTIKNAFNDSGAKYCKMPDGTMILWGSGYYENTTTITFSPCAFISEPSVFVCQIYDTSSVTLNAIEPSATSFKIKARQAGWGKWFAIGRWKA